MVKKVSYLCSTIGRKQLVGLTGLGLAGFVLTHMLGNLLILVGPEAYNKYSHALITNPLLIVAEAGLLLMFAGHIVLALYLAVQNKMARPTGYAVRSHGAKGTNWIMRTLWMQGLLILVFVILHLITFKYGTHYTTTYDGVEMRDLHKLIVEVFHNQTYVVWYLVALLVLGFHLSHGVKSSLQSFGIHNPRMQCGFKLASWAYAIIVTAGFIVQPLYVYFIYQGSN